MDPHLIHSKEDLKSKKNYVRNGWQGRCAISQAEREEYMTLMRKGVCTAYISKLYEKRHKKKLAGSTIHNWRLKIKDQEIREYTARKNQLVFDPQSSFHSSGQLIFPAHKVPKPPAHQVILSIHPPVPIEGKPEKPDSYYPIPEGMATLPDLPRKIEPVGFFLHRDRQNIVGQRRHSISNDPRCSSLSQTRQKEPVRMRSFTTSQRMKFLPALETIDEVPETKSLVTGSSGASLFDMLYDEKGINDFKEATLESPPDDDCFEVDSKIFHGSFQILPSHTLSGKYTFLI